MVDACGCLRSHRRRDLRTVNGTTPHKKQADEWVKKNCQKGDGMSNIYCTRIANIRAIANLMKKKTLQCQVVAENDRVNLWNDF